MFQWLIMMIHVKLVLALRCAVWLVLQPVVVRAVAEQIQFQRTPAQDVFVETSGHIPGEEYSFLVEYN